MLQPPTTAPSQTNCPSALFDISRCVVAVGLEAVAECQLVGFVGVVVDLIRTPRIPQVAPHEVSERAVGEVFLGLTGSLVGPRRKAIALVVGEARRGIVA